MVERIIRDRQEISELIHGKTQEEKQEQEQEQEDEQVERMDTKLLIVDIGDDFKDIEKTLMSINDSVVDDDDKNSMFKTVLNLNVNHIISSNGNGNTNKSSKVRSPTSQGIISTRQSLISLIEKFPTVGLSCGDIGDDLVNLRFFQDLFCMGMISLHGGADEDEDEEEGLDDSVAEFASCLPFHVLFKITDKEEDKDNNAPNNVHNNDMSRLIRVSQMVSTPCDHLILPMVMDQEPWGVVQTLGNDDWIIGVNVKEGLSIWRLEEMVRRFKHRVVINFQLNFHKGKADYLFACGVLEFLQQHELLMRYVLGFMLNKEPPTTHGSQHQEDGDEEVVEDDSYVFEQDTTMEISVITHELGPELKALDFQTSTPVRTPVKPTIRQSAAGTTSGLFSKRLLLFENLKGSYDRVSKNLSKVFETHSNRNKKNEAVLHIVDDEHLSYSQLLLGKIKEAVQSTLHER